jgi:hypothetical protein
MPITTPQISVDPNQPPPHTYSVSLGDAGVLGALIAGIVWVAPKAWKAIEQQIIVSNQRQDKREETDNKIELDNANTLNNITKMFMQDHVEASRTLAENSIKLQEGQLNIQNGVISLTKEMEILARVSRESTAGINQISNNLEDQYHDVIAKLNSIELFTHTIQTSLQKHANTISDINEIKTTLARVEDDLAKIQGAIAQTKRWL